MTVRAVGLAVWIALAVACAVVFDDTTEAIVNALVAARTMTGYKGRRVVALPHERVRTILQRHGRLQQP